MKIVIFGAGKLFQQLVQEIDFRDVVGMIDNDYAKHYAMQNGHLVLQPERLHEFSYDYVVIFNQTHAAEMKEQLINIGVASEKVISWQEYIYVLKRGNSFFSYEAFGTISSVLQQLQITKAVDVDGGIEHSGFYITGQDLRECLQKVYIYKDINVSAKEDKYNPNVYCGIVGAYELKDKHIEVAFFLDYFENHSIKEWEHVVSELKGNVRYIFIAVPPWVGDQWTDWTGFDYEYLGDVTRFRGKLVDHLLISLKDEAKTGIKDEYISIYTVAHKTFSIPHDGLHQVIGVNGFTADAIWTDGTGNNIAHLNGLLNELTAVYWVWKNRRNEVVGFCHYRRFFGHAIQGYNPYTGLIKSQEILDDLMDHDVLTATAICTYPNTVERQLCNTLPKVLFCEVKRLVEEQLQAVCPKYIKAYQDTMQGIVLYPCNMFIMKWELFDGYCSWLFSIFLPIAGKFNVEGYDAYSCRALGFWAERMLTVWIRHNHLKVKELEIISTE